MFSMPSFFCTTWIMVMIISLQMHGYISCIETERKGLLELKASVNNSQFPYDWPNDKNSDCCNWEGLKCDPTSRHVISLSLGPNSYDSTSPLNLSKLYPFGELQILNLNYFHCTYWFDDIEGYKSLGRLKKLEVLDFSFGGVNNVNSVLPFLNAASSLKNLSLHGNAMDGIFPIKELKNLRKLELLDLSMNQFIGPLQGLENFQTLQRLDLSDNEFSGSLEEMGLCQLKFLRELDMSRNKFTGQFPQCFDSLTQLQVLDISSNQLNGTLPSVFSSFTSIEYLSLSDNEFEGLFSLELIANLSKLKVFKLSSKSSLLHIVTDNSLQPKFQLSVIELQNCNLKKVPSILQHQKDLRLINLSHNKLTGEFPTWILVKYPKLEILLLQNNSFSIFQLSRLVHSLKVFDVSTNKLDGRLLENFGNVLPNLRHLNLSNNQFQGNLPSSFKEMKMLHFLDLSHNNLSGKLPKEFLMGCYSMRFLKLSFNMFSGLIFSEPTNLTSLSILMADHNRFSGIAVGLLHSKDLHVLDVSNNYLRGLLPTWLSGFHFTFLLVSNNILEGTIPSNLFNISTITLMDLSRNNFSGNLPQHFNCEPVCMLFLNENKLNGSIPAKLLENLMVLDLRNNNLSGTIPRFVNSRFIEYLLLRGNILTGHIPKDLCGTRSIKILDLANNSLKGSIPSCLNNVSFGRELDDHIFDGYGYTVSTSTIVDNIMGSYFGSLVLPLEFDPDYSSELKFIFEFASKSRYDSYNERSFDFMFGMDLSNNELSGEIPKELGDLQRIRALNLSHNSFSGIIPESFSNLTDIESLDLSFNMLHGQIPHDLTKLHYLVVFNVSYNNLSGSIPSQGNFITFDETSYIANPLLCGSPVNRSCDNDTPEADYQSGDEETTIDMEVFYWTLAVTYSLTWMAFIVFLCFDSPWRRAWFRLVDAFLKFFTCA